MCSNILVKFALVPELALYRQLSREFSNNIIFQNLKLMSGVILVCLQSIDATFNVVIGATSITY